MDECVGFMVTIYVPIGLSYVSCHDDYIRCNHSHSMQASLTTHFQVLGLNMLHC